MLRCEGGGGGGQKNGRKMRKVGVKKTLAKLNACIHILIKVQSFFWRSA